MVTCPECGEVSEVKTKFCDQCGYNYELKRGKVAKIALGFLTLYLIIIIYVLTFLVRGETPDAQPLNYLSLVSGIASLLLIFSYISILLPTKLGGIKTCE